MLLNKIILITRLERQAHKREILSSWSFFNIARRLAIFFIISVSVSAHASSFLDQLVAEEIAKKIQSRKGQVEVFYNKSYDLDHLRAQEQSIESLSISRLDNATSTFAANVKVARGNSYSISGKYVAYVELPVASRIIKNGAVIEHDDIFFIKTKLQDIPHNAAIDEKEILGMQAKRRIMEAGYFKLNDLSRPNVIKQNDPVNIVFSSGNISLKTIGVAMGSGAVGDMIKVKNETSGVVILGNIINKNTVEVNGE